MWLFKAKIYVLLILITSCSFTPLYSSRNTKVVDTLAAIEVIDNNEIDTQNISLTQQLKESLNVLNKDVLKKYILEIKYSTDLHAELVSRNVDLTTARISLNLKYILKDKYSQKVLNSGQLVSSGTFNITSSELSTYTAENYIEQTIVKEILDSLKQSLSITIFNLQL
jgi:hypothetical protein